MRVVPRDNRISRPCLLYTSYESIYKQAKSSIYVVDNYIGLRTLVHLKNSPTGVDIILFSDNVGNNKLHNIEFTDFCKEYPTVNLSMKKTGGIFHDRFIVLDYGCLLYTSLDNNTREEVENFSKTSGNSLKYISYQ